MSSVLRRIEKIEASLTPRQAVIKWMSEAHQHSNMQDYVTSLRGAPETAFPLYWLPDQTEKAVYAKMKGRPLRSESLRREEVAHEARQAVRDVIFLFHLHQQVNSRLMGEHNEWVFCLMWLRAELRWLRHECESGEASTGRQERRQLRSSRKLRFGSEAWKTSAETLLRELYDLREAIASISARYFDGQQVLFPEVAQEFNDILDKAELLADVYNTYLVLSSMPSGVGGRRRLPRGRINVVAVEAQGRELSPTIAVYMVDMAKAEALDSLGDNRAAVAVMDRHVWRDEGDDGRTL